jgi:SET domain-containing protein 6
VKHLHVLHGHEAQLGLALALHVEMLRGTTSRWWGYLQSLPQKLSLPLLWTKNDADDTRQALYWASGTQIQREMNSGVDLVSMPAAVCCL